MSAHPNSYAEYCNRLRGKTPAFLDLATARTHDESEAAFTTLLEIAIQHLEKNKKNYAKLNEEGLSGALAGALSIPGLLVATQEANSNGHVDLMIEINNSKPARVKLGEAKLYSGPSHHIKGISQLLGRYTTGRETPGLLINYVRRKDIKGITAKLKTAMDKKRPENQTSRCQNHKLKWSLVTKHRHSSGELISIGHIGCNLHV